MLPYLVDFIVELDEQLKEEPTIRILKPFIIEKVFSFESNKPVKFIYHLYQKGIITRDQINNKIKSVFKYDYHDHYFEKFVFWFLPEIKELGFNIDNEIRSDVQKHIEPYLPDKIEMYKQMRDAGEPTDRLTKALRSDDVDTLQSIICRKENSFLDSTVPFNWRRYI